MKVIILSCNTGEGHNTAGNAIIEGMRARGVEADMVNALELMGVKRSKLIAAPISKWSANCRRCSDSFTIWRC